MIWYGTALKCDWNGGAEAASANGTRKMQVRQRTHHTNTARFDGVGLFWLLLFYFVAIVSTIHTSW